MADISGKAESPETSEAAKANMPSALRDTPRPAATFKNRLLFTISMVLLGVIAGAIVWLFLFLVDLLTGLIWHTLPTYLNIAVFPLFICIIGGVILGLYEKRFGAWPESLDTVLGKVKESKRYEYKRFGAYSVGALLPLVFGGSIGPESGLTGIVAGICTWVGDRMRRFGDDFKAMTEVGTAAALSAVFTAPLFGIAAPLYGSTGKSNDNKGERDYFDLPKTSKVIVYLCTVAGALGMFVFLKGLTGESGGLPHFSEMSYGMTELIWTVPLILAGAAAGWLYHILDGAAVRVNDRIGNRPVVKAVIGGAFLGGIGLFVPMVFFAGEAEMAELAETWMGYPVLLLFLIGVLKLFTTAYCIRSGWRGGHFFPTIFSGVAIGLGFAAISGADPVFCMCACVGALVGCLTKQPVLTMLLLLLCFPLKGIVITIVAAAVGAALPLPKPFRQHLD